MDSPWIWIKSFLPNLSQTKEYNLLMNVYPFELPVITAFWGRHMTQRKRADQVYKAYAKVRNHDFMSKLWIEPITNRRRMMWTMLEWLEPVMGLRFKAVDGRNGATFDETYFENDPEAPR
jgi:hypothetical protein